MLVGLAAAESGLGEWVRPGSTAGGLKPELTAAGVRAGVAGDTGPRVMPVVGLAAAAAVAAAAADSVFARWLGTCAAATVAAVVAAD